jgi:beta-galactosidase
MRTRTARQILVLALAAILAASVPAALGGAASLAQDRATVDATPLRVTQMLNEGWQFIQDDTLTDEQALRATGDAWTTVTLPHTWNAQDAQPASHKL